MTDRHQVVVVGGGFGGLNAVRALAHADVDVTVVDRTNHHLFQPLLYQVAAGILPPGTDRARAARRDQEAGERARGAGRGHRLSTSKAGTEAGGHRLRPGRAAAHAALRHARRRRGGDPLLLRPRRVRSLRPRHEDDRERPASAGPDPARVRDGRARDRPGRAGGVADVRRDRGGSDRCRAGGAGRRARAQGAATRLPHGRHEGGPDPAPGGGGRGARPVPREAARRTPSTSWRRWASRCGSTRWPSTWTTRASPSRARTGQETIRTRTRIWAAGRGGVAAGEAARRRRQAWRSTGRAASAGAGSPSAAARSPGIPRCSRSATWCR